uniref:TOG domain-containing protein n=1 Tax=Anopheles coluzzii TaxID=1518534 RepID=A0A8W7PFY5_ANOCL
MFFRRVFAKNAAGSSSSGDSATSSNGNTGGGSMHAMHGSSLGMSANGVPLESPARYRRALNVEDNHRVLSVLQLTPLWEYIIRNNELPVGLNMNELFREFLERLHDPEFQVRQHALRVLIDVIIVLRDETDIYFAPVLPPIIDNLGHPSPAVRKGALDVLKVYIAQTKLPETVMLEIMNYGMDRNPKDPLSSRYIVGVMLALPSLIQPAILTAKRTFILRAVINALGGKMVQITYQEIALKILLKIKNTIGSREFYECISVAYRRDFDLLCNVYGLPNPPKSPRRDPVIPPGEIPLGNVDMRKSWKPTVTPGAPMPPMQPLSPKAQRWKSGSHGDISRSTVTNDPVRLRHRVGSDERLPAQHDYILSKGPGGGPLLRRVSLEKIDDSKVIMETEIKINKESVTMRILEAENSNSNSISEESDEDNANKRFGVVRVLTDSELEDSVTVKSIAGSQATMQQELLHSSDTEYVRRTPRRVRFGGEIVKMRTPDSDTFDQSDQDALTLSQTSNQSTQLLSSSSATSDRTSSTMAPPQRSSLKSASSSSDRSSTAYSNTMMRRQYSQSADTERSSPPSTMALSSSDFNSSFTSKLRPSSAKSIMETSGLSELNSGSDPEDNLAPSMVASSVAEEVDHSASRASSRPKSSLTRPKSAKTPPPEPKEIQQPEPVKINNTAPQHPETPDAQSRPEPDPLTVAALDASSILADKIEEVKQAIQGIESKINNVVMQKADSIDTVQNHNAGHSSTPKLEPNLSLEVLMKTNHNENAANLEQDPSQAEHNKKDYTKELNIEIPKEEKLQNAPPPPSPKPAQAADKDEGVTPVTSQTKPIPKIVRSSGIPRLNTMPSPKTMRKAHETLNNAPKSPTTTGSSDGKGQLTPQPANAVRGRTLSRSRSATSATMKRSVYISPSSLSPKPHSGIEMIHNLLRSPSTSPHRSRRKSSNVSDAKALDMIAASDKNNNNTQLISSVSESVVDGRTDKCISVNEDDIFDVFGKTIATQTSVDELVDRPAPFVPFTRTPSRLAFGAPSDANGNEIISTLSPCSSSDGHEKFVSFSKDRAHSPNVSRPESPKQTQPSMQQIISSWEDLGIVSRLTLLQLKSPDWRLRSQGFCSIEEALKSSDNLAKVQPYLESLLRTLLSSERNLDVIDDKVRMLVNLVSRLPLENLEDRVGQIMTGLCRQGGPGSNTVAKALMQRLPTAAIVQRLLSDDFLHAKSSKKLFIPRACEARDDEEVDGGELVVMFPPPVMVANGYGPPTTASSDVLIMVEFNDETQEGEEEEEEEDEEIEEELAISRPRSRVQSASMGNLQHLDRIEVAEQSPVPVSPKKILKKPFLVRRSSKVAPVKEVVSSVKAKNKLNEVIFQKTLRRFEKPKDALNNCLTHLESPNWEQNISGLQFFVRLIRHHPEVIDTQIHLLSVALAKQVRNLRSQVARAACQASAEFFATHRRCLEGEAEDIATHLLHRTADTNKFLRADATQALEAMCDNVSIPKVVHIISYKGATHQNAVVRTTAAKLLNKIVQQLGSEKVFALPKETRDKLILTGAHLLLEGSLETRNYTKSMFKQLADHSNYSKVLLEVIPPRTYRNIEKSLNSIRQMS